MALGDSDHRALVSGQSPVECTAEWPHLGSLQVLLGLKTTWVDLVTAVMAAMVVVMTLQESVKKEQMLNSL